MHGGEIYHFDDACLPFLSFPCVTPQTGAGCGASLIFARDEVSLQGKERAGLVNKTTTLVTMPSTSLTLFSGPAAILPRCMLRWRSASPDPDARPPTPRNLHTQQPLLPLESRTTPSPRKRDALTVATPVTSQKKS
jgi:hypothetical protein